MKRDPVRLRSVALMWIQILLMSVSLLGAVAHSDWILFSVLAALCVAFVVLVPMGRPPPKDPPAAS